MNFARLAVWSLGFAALMACPVLAAAQSPAAAAEVQRLLEQVRGSATTGPAEIPLAGKGVLKLPAGHSFVPQPQAGSLMRAIGSPVTDLLLLGMVFPQPGQSWFMTVRYEDAGHVGDNEARDWNADVMMKAFRDSAATTNADRARLGAPPIEVAGWAEQPAYDAAGHRLVWAAIAHPKDTPAGALQQVNYNAYVLGREGYYALNLVTPLEDLPANKPAAHAMLAALDFNEGQRYADFDEKTDRRAAHGLGALVVGQIGTKTVLGGGAGLLLIEHGKATAVALVALCVGVFMLFKRGMRNGRPEAPPAPPVA